MNFRQECAIYHKSRKYADIVKNIIVYGFMLAIFLIFFFCVFGRLSWICYISYFLFLCLRQVVLDMERYYLYSIVYHLSLYRRSGICFD